jgi:hypothetical protein
LAVTRDGEREMTVVQGILLAAFIYLGIAMFKPEWF